jgi:hypothetical protein
VSEGADTIVAISLDQKLVLRMSLPMVAIYSQKDSTSTSEEADSQNIGLLESEARCRRPVFLSGGTPQLVGLRRSPDSGRRLSV